MSRVHLVGGGRDDALVVPLYSAFVADAAAFAGRPAPRIDVLLVLEEDDTESRPRYRRVLDAAGAPGAQIHSIFEGQAFDRSAVADAHGIVIGGGLTPAYLDAVAPIAADVSARVASGAAYLGFSAGAAIAASHAVVGGWLLDGVAVGDEHAGEELDELVVRAGLGLVPFSVDVHAAQWGTLSRLVAAVEAGLTVKGFAVDEHTALIVTAAHGAPEVVGTGAAWRVASDHGTRVTRLTAGYRTNEARRPT